MEATLTPPAIPDARVVEGSDGMLLEIDGQIVPNYDATIVPFEEGDVVTGKVVRIDKDEVLVDIGYKSEGVIPNNELSIRKSVDPNEEVELGEEVDALVLTKEDQDGRLILSKKRARFERAWRKIEAAAESGEPVNGAVIEVVKGGLIVDLGVRGFLPASLVDIRRVPNLDEYLGQTIQTKVIELNRSRNNVVLSRRAVLEEERKEQRQAILERLQPGLIIEGQISNIVDFGAFVDLDGIDGLIHISELSWSHVNHPSEVLTIGETVEVKVLDIDRDRQRISLGLKQTQEDPWQRVVDTYHVGDELEGTVTKVVAFGAFVEILEGVEGLVHISELAQQHVENPREIVAARRRGEGQDPGDRLRAAPPLALDQAGRGPGAAAPHRGPEATPATSRTCRSSACPRTSSPRGPAAGRRPRRTRPSRREAEAEAESRRGRGAPRPSRRPPSPRPRRAEAEAPTAEAEPAEAPTAEATEKRVSAAVRRPDRRNRRGEVRGARRARPPGRGDDLRPTRSCTSSTRSPRCATPSSRAGGPRWRRTAAWTAPRSPGARSPRPRSAPGWSSCCGRGSGEQVAEWRARRATGRGAGRRDAAAVRGRPGARLRRHDRRRRRREGAERAGRGARARGARRAHGPPARARGEGRRATYAVENSGSSTNWSRSCRRSLRS